MLQEAISYQDNFPISITVADIRKYPIHYHMDTEIVYVLEGSVNLRNGYCTYELNAGDIFTNAGHEVHTMESEAPNVVAVFHISNLFFTQFFPELPKGCYRTNPSGEPNPQLLHLKHTLIQMLIAYLQKNINYKDACIEYCMELVRTLNQHFNLFSFRDNVVVHFSCDNPVIEERISHVINYIYANYETKITLDDLAEIEHLSSYYLSHLIHQYCGISFREFLSFARAEWSEIPLLETNKKINGVAQMVGFSTSKYYEEAFQKWFGHTPQEHRRAYGHDVLSPDNPAEMEEIPVLRGLEFARKQKSKLVQQDAKLDRVKRRRYAERISAEAKCLEELRHSLRVSVTAEDFSVLGDALLGHLQQLRCSEVELIGTEDGEARQCDALERELVAQGLSVERTDRKIAVEYQVHGYDAAPGLIYEIHQGLQNPQELMSIRLRDQGDPDVILKGGRTLLTSAGVPKPVYTAVEFLSRNRGELVVREKYYSVLRLPGGNAYLIAAMNYNNEILGLCQGPNTVYRTEEVMEAFQDELNVDITLELPSGEYLVTRYFASNHGSLFGIMGKLHFPEKLSLAYDMHMEYTAGPLVDAYVEQVEKELTVDMNFRGVGAQALLVQKI